MNDSTSVRWSYFAVNLQSASKVDVCRLHFSSVLTITCSLIIYVALSVLATEIRAVEREHGTARKFDRKYSRL